MERPRGHGRDHAQEGPSPILLPRQALTSDNHHYVPNGDAGTWHKRPCARHCATPVVGWMTTAVAGPIRAALVCPHPLWHTCCAAGGPRPDRREPRDACASPEPHTGKDYGCRAHAPEGRPDERAVAEPRLAPTGHQSPAVCGPGDHARRGIRLCPPAGGAAPRRPPGYALPQWAGLL